MSPEAGAAPALAAAFPQLVREIEGALIRLGRGSVADQLRGLAVAGWDYDEFADAAIINVSVLPDAGEPGRGIVPQGRGETIALHDDVPVSVDIDPRGRIVSLEILDARELLPALQAIAAR